MAKPDSHWYRLDNAGILYSALQREEYSAIYRFSALLDEPVPLALDDAEAAMKAQMAQLSRGTR